MMRHLFFGLVALGVGVASTAALGTEDPILTRQKLMYANGAAFYGIAVKMYEGKMAFDPAVAASVLRTTNAAAYSFGDYFPEGSQTGAKTKASPKIWQDMAGFQAALVKNQQATDAAIAAKPEDLESFKELVFQIGETCSGCHDTYRLKDD